MARIKGVDIPNDKHTCISLTYIYGIGRSLAKQICEKAKVDPTKKAGDLTIEEQNALRDVINEHLVEGDLRREVNMNIKTIWDYAFEFGKSASLWLYGSLWDNTTIS